MISILGRSLVMAALLFATTGAVIGFHAGWQRSIEGWRRARIAAYGFGLSMILANALMIYALLTRDFSVAYVAEVGSWATPNYYTVISLWASLNGSILFWGGVLGLYVVGVTWAHRESHREYMPYTLGTLLAISVFFALLIASIANPFAPVPPPIPTDGPGPNPLLQNHPLMAFHPPMLYLGYVGMAVPFSMCCAALLAGRLEAGWVAPLRRWFLVPWTFLTIGIVMGGWWSYEVLGWGGYWAWDPVENASFLPWLTGTAFLHSAMVVQRKGDLKAWTLILGMASFLLTLLGTFMTRSGVFNSVHSFTQSDIGPVFLGAIAVAFIVSVLLLAFREHTLHERADAKPPAGATGLLNRENTILLQNVGFAVFTFTVLLGVLYPLIAEAFLERQVSVGQPYFDRMALPIGLVLVFLMGVGPAVPWGRMGQEAAMRRFLAPVLGAVIAVALAWFAGGIRGENLYTLLAIAVCTFALVAHVGELVEPVVARVRGKGENPATALAQVVSRGRKRFGGHVAHLGVLMAVIAIAFSSGFKHERDFVLTPGQAAEMGGWTATFVDVREEPQPHRNSLVARFTLARDGAQVGVLEPRLNFYRRMVEPIGTPAVRSTVTGDLYMSLLQVEGDGERISIRVMTMPLVPWLWVSCGVIAAGVMMVLWPQRVREAATAASPAAQGPTAMAGGPS